MESIELLLDNKSMRNAVTGNVVATKINDEHIIIRQSERKRMVALDRQTESIFLLVPDTRNTRLITVKLHRIINTNGIIVTRNISIHV
jgi:hypothetical protein